MILFNRFRDGATINVLADALDELREILRGVRAISFTGESHDIITYVADLLGPCECSKNLLLIFDMNNPILTLNDY